LDFGSSNNRTSSTLISSYVTIIAHLAVCLQKHPQKNVKRASSQEEVRTLKMTWADENECTFATNPSLHIGISFGILCMVFYLQLAKSCS